MGKRTPKLAEYTYRPILREIYRHYGFEVKYINGKENEKYDGILINAENNTRISIEEKGLSYYHKCCPIELIQDIKTQNMGWFYKTEAKYIIFIYFENKQPYICYLIKMGLLKEYPAEYLNHNGCFTALALGGWGDTVNLNIPWEQLIQDNIASVLERFS